MASDPHRISLEDALVMVRRAQAAPPLPVKGWSIGGAIIQEILAQPGATGLRAYLALDDKGDPTLVFVGVNGDGNDLHEGVIAEFVWPCPPVCPDTSPFLTP